MEGKYCFTYCGDEACDCGAGPNYLPSGKEDARRMTLPDEVLAITTALAKASDEQINARWDGSGRTGLDFSALTQAALDALEPLGYEVVPVGLADSAKALAEALGQISRMKRSLDAAINMTTLHAAIEVAAQALAAYNASIQGGGV